jgi:hypothetical protein
MQELQDSFSHKDQWDKRDTLAYDDRYNKRGEFDFLVQEPDAYNIC